MTDLAAIRLCSEEFHACRCFKPVDHDGPHECKCLGSWEWEAGEVHVVALPDLGLGIIGPVQP